MECFCFAFYKSICMLGIHLIIRNTFGWLMGWSYGATNLLFHLCVDGRFSKIGSHIVLMCTFFQQGLVANSVMRAYTLFHKFNMYVKAMH